MLAHEVGADHEAAESRPYKAERLECRSNAILSAGARGLRALVLAHVAKPAVARLLRLIQGVQAQDSPGRRLDESTVSIGRAISAYFREKRRCAK